MRTHSVLAAAEPAVWFLPLQLCGLPSHRRTCLCPINNMLTHNKLAKLRNRRSAFLFMVSSMTSLLAHAVVPALVPGPALVDAVDMVET